MIKKIKRLIALARKDPKALEVLEGLSDEQLALVPDANDENVKPFFSEGSQEEFIEYEKEQQGLKPWYERIKNL